MNPPIKIYCGKMNVFHESRGLMLTSDQQDPPARWETTGPDGQPLGGPITFPATYVREKSLVEWWVDACVAGELDGVVFRIKSNLPKERCDFVLWCSRCECSYPEGTPGHGHTGLIPHVIARAILAPTTVWVPGFVGEVWQPVQSPFASTGRWETDIASKPNPFAGQQGIVYTDCPGYWTGIGQITMQPIVATGEIRWSKV